MKKKLLTLILITITILPLPSSAYQFLPGDFDSNHFVAIDDLQSFADHWLSSNLVEQYDINNDDCVNLLDFSSIGRYWDREQNIYNFSFEEAGQSPSNALYWEQGDPEKSFRISDTQAKDGYYVLEIPAGDAWANAYQTITIEDPEIIYRVELTGYAKYSNPSTNNKGILKILFLDSNNTVILTKDTFFLSNSDPIDTWKKGELISLIPSATRSISVQVMNSASGTGTIYFDDINLSLKNILATSPWPSDKKLEVPTETDLNWISSIDSTITSQNVFFGTDYIQVKNATINDTAFKGSLGPTISSFDLDTLEPATNYYWRIDLVSGQETITGKTWSFRTPGVLFYDFTDKDLTYDEKNLALCLQGLMNRQISSLFYNTGMQYYFTNADIYWKEYLADEKGCSFVQVDNLRELIKNAVDFGLIKGLILYDPTNIDGAELQMAENYCSRDSLLPVTQEILNYSTSGIAPGDINCFENLIVTDIRNNWVTSYDAHVWAISEFMNDSSKEILYADGGRNYSEGAKLTSRDFGIMKKSFFFNLTDSNEHSPLWDQILFHLNPPGHVFGLWIWETGENYTTSKISSSGNSWMCSHMASNLSFWANLPPGTKDFDLSKDVKRKTLDANKYYILFQTSEGDTPKIISSMLDSQWQNSRRGKLPIGWGISPVSLKYFPSLIEYYKATSTANDTFFSGPSGAGYNWLSYIPNIKEFATESEKYFSQTGIKLVDIWGFEMNEIEIYKYYAPSIRCYTGQQSYNHTNTSLSDGTKVVRCSEQYNLFYPDERAPNENIVDLITGFAATKQPPYFITVYDEPSDIMEYIHECNDELGSEFVIVGVEDFINLQYLPSQNWILLTYDDFEDGFGNFVDAGSDCILYTGESRAFQGNNAVNLQNNTSSSLIYLANPLDLESYTKLKVEFFFYTYGLENNEGFFVEYFNGDNWIQVAHFKAGTDFDNGQFLFKSFILTNREVNFSNNSNLRFRNNTDSSYDDVYLDKVEISALQ